MNPSSGTVSFEINVSSEFTLNANCLNRLYLTNCRMFDNTEISKGMSDALPPSRTHVCAIETSKKHS
jgi:hypothetical protein